MKSEAKAIAEAVRHVFEKVMRTEFEAAMICDGSEDAFDRQMIHRLIGCAEARSGRSNWS